MKSLRRARQFAIILLLAGATLPAYTRHALYSWEDSATFFAGSTTSSALGRTFWPLRKSEHHPLKFYRGSRPVSKCADYNEREPCTTDALVLCWERSGSAPPKQEVLGRVNGADLVALTYPSLRNRETDRRWPTANLTWLVLLVSRPGAHYSPVYAECFFLGERDLSFKRLPRQDGLEVVEVIYRHAETESLQELIVFGKHTSSIISPYADAVKALQAGPGEPNQGKYLLHERAELDPQTLEFRALTNDSQSREQRTAVFKTTITRDGLKFRFDHKESEQYGVLKDRQQGLSGVVKQLRELLPPYRVLRLAEGQALWEKGVLDQATSDSTRRLGDKSKGLWSLPDSKLTELSNKIQSRSQDLQQVADKLVNHRSETALPARRSIPPIHTAEIPTAEISGRVIRRESGHGIPDSKITLQLHPYSHTPESPTEFWPSTFEMKSGPDGHYAFPVVPPGTYSISVQSDDAYPVLGAGENDYLVTVPSDKSTKAILRDLFLYSGHTLHGRIVRDVDRSPVSDLAVYADQARTKTAPDGMFSIPHLHGSPRVAIHDSTLRILDDDVRGGEIPVVLPSDRNDVDLGDIHVGPVSDMITIRGNIQDEAGKPLGGARVNLDSARRKNESFTTTREGEYHFLVEQDTPTVRLAVEADRFQKVIHPPFNVFSSPIPAIDFTLQRTKPKSGQFAMAGHVVGPSGMPAEMATVKCGDAWLGTSGSDGSFSGSVQTSGPKTFIAYKANVGYLESEPITIGQGPTTSVVELRLKPFKRGIKGRVIGPDGHPTASVYVYARSKYFEQQSANVDGDGNFEFRGLPEVPIELEAQYFWGDVESVKVQLPSPGINDLVIRLKPKEEKEGQKKPTAVVEVQVVDSKTSEPIGRSQVIASRNGYPEDVSTGYGHQRIGHIDPNLPVTLFTQAAGYSARLTAPFRLDPGTTFTCRTIALNEGSTVTVKLGLPIGESHDQLLVSLQLEDPDGSGAYSPDRPTITHLGADSTITPLHATAGLSRLTVYCPWLKLPFIKSINVPDNGTLDLGQINLPTAACLAGRFVYAGYDCGLAGLPASIGPTGCGCETSERIPTDSRGGFSFNGMRPGPITVSLPDYGISLETTLEETGSTVTCYVGTLPTSGTITIGRERELLNVEMRQPQEDGTFVLSRCTDHDGSYSFAVMLPGKYEVRIKPCCGRNGTTGKGEMVVAPDGTMSAVKPVVATPQ